MDIYCKNRICPICDGEMKLDHQGDVACKNHCYTLCYGTDTMPFAIMIFCTYSQNTQEEGFFELDKYYITDSGEIEINDLSLIESKIAERVYYWREDYRYLAEILIR